MHSIKRLAIANRGEVAVRIIRACHELGIETVLLHSEADVKTIAYRLSDFQVCIGPAAVGESYLNIKNNINGALSLSAQAIHPGFGFLSENADFAQSCINAQLLFIGPTPENIKLLGDKIECKKLVESLGIKTIPGYAGDNQDINFLLKKCDELGYPLLTKAAAGGGGRGLKIIASKKEAQEKIEAAQREALSAFGSKKIFLEKYLDHAKHIEVQIFGDATGRIFSLYERECSVQRKYQKIIEEGPSAFLNETQRSAVHTLARKIASAANYKNAGTVEFLFQDGEFYFIEVNTRLQVEHTVTECILGIDLVKSQIQTSMGEPLSWSQEKLLSRGHAIEARIYAEDPHQGGIPSTGDIGYLHLPQGPGRRFDFGIETGDMVTPFYDSMIGKIIIWDESRLRCIQKMLKVFNETIVFGVKTNIPLLKAIISHPEFISAKMNTHFIENYFPNALGEKKLTSQQIEFAQWANREISSAELSQSSHKNISPWQTSWRLF